MYKAIKIGEKEYHLEYSIEASLYADCISSLTGLMADMESAENDKDIKKMLSGMSNIPQTSLTLFYAGLLEEHGTQTGDGTVPDLSAAKRLIAQYMKEHKDDDTGNFYGVMQICIEQMNEDGFFNLLGLNAMNKAGQKPKKTTKASGK